MRRVSAPVSFFAIPPPSAAGGNTSFFFVLFTVVADDDDVVDEDGGVSANRTNLFVDDDAAVVDDDSVGVGAGAPGAGLDAARTMAFFLIVIAFSSPTNGSLSIPSFPESIGYADR